MKDTIVATDESFISINKEVKDNKNEISSLVMAQKILSGRQDAFVVRLDGELGRFNRSMDQRGTAFKNEIATIVETMVQGTEDNIEKIDGNFKPCFYIFLSVIIDF